MFFVIREAKAPPSSASITVNATKSSLEGSIVGIPIRMVDCGAPGRSIRWTARFDAGFGSDGAAAEPFVQPANALRIAASIADESKRPTT